MDGEKPATNGTEEKKGGEERERVPNDRGVLECGGTTPLSFRRQVGGPQSGNPLPHSKIAKRDGAGGYLG